MKAFNMSWQALTESKLAIVLFAGVFVGAVILVSVPPQFPVHGPNVLLRGSPGNEGAGSPAGETNGHAQPPLALADVSAESPVPSKHPFEGKETAPTSAPPPPPLKPICDLTDRRYDGCEMWGDARTASGANKSSVYFIPPPSQLAAAASSTWSIRSQSRKMIAVREVTVRSLNLSTLHEAPSCTLRRSVPAVVFALGGLTFNYWHAFSDVLVPLFTTARAFGGEVELVATGSQSWFLRKYERVFEALSRYEVVDLDASGGEVRCYSHLVVGLRGHRDFDIDPARAPNNYSLLAFRLFVRAAYSLPPPPAAALPCRSSSSGAGGATRRPRLMIILRGATRRFVNADAVVSAIERAGFEVVRMEPASGMGMDAVSRAVDACDVLVGAHGAGLTNMVFLRAGAVVVQVIPWGKMEPYGEGFFGAPAAHMGIRHVPYSIAAEESTLYEKYGRDHPVITDPDVFYRNGSNARFYWREQNIRLNTTRFEPTLEVVKRMLRE
ncbi:unnamed protein product [Urochloa decumbens]|uniref:Glycosyltransferase 61 catalytic domain-containing protein n=1 Tax=Urochloa decumbens TaxID=240449 RepID=A0ABC9CJB0_9POAL